MFYYEPLRNTSKKPERNFNSFDFLKEGGFFNSLILHAGVTVGFSQNRLLNIMLMSFAAGFSERMVPNPINQFEGITRNEFPNRKK